MFKKTMLLFAVAFVSTIGTMRAQPVFTIGSTVADPGEDISINIVFDEFIDYVAFQFELNWNPAVISFQSIGNVTGALPSFSGVLGGDNINLLQDGALRVSWAHPSVTPTSLPNGTLLFTVNLLVVGDPCDETDLTMQDVEVGNVAGTNVGATIQPGHVEVPGVDCGTPGEGLRIFGTSHTIPSGGSVCIPFRCEGFENIIAGNFAMQFNPAVIRYTGIQNINWPGFVGGQPTFNDANADNGILVFVWTDPSTQGLSIPNGTVLYELCFDAIGSGGQTSTVAFVNNPSPPTPIEFNDSNSEIVPFEGVPGSVTIEGDIEGFALIAGSGPIQPGTEVCVPITVNDFVDIIGMQFSINWDSTFLRFTRFRNFNLIELTDGVAGPEVPGNNGGQATVSWIDPALLGQSLANGTSLFDICFDVIGSCAMAPTIVSVSETPLEIEVADVDGSIDVITVSGTLDCEVGCGATVVNVTHVCAGQETGGIEINVFGSCMMPISFQWSSGQTTQNLTNVPPGKYVVTITTGNEFIILDTITISVLDPIEVSANITDVVAGGDGAINITVSGGLPGYSYLWSDPAQSTTANISGLNVGSYSVTITDANGCVFNGGPYQVNDATSIVAQVTHVDCFGAQTGGINVTAVNCVPGPHTFAWSPSGAGPVLTNLPAGMYTVTVTGSDANTCETTFTVLQASSALEVVVDTVNETSAGNDGAIAITVTGGQGPYTYQWSDIGPGGPIRTGLAGGVYEVTITDQFGCMIERSIALRGNTLFVDIAAANYNGFGVSCAGICDGELIAMPGNNLGNTTFQWSNGMTGQAIADLCVGNYSVTITDQTGQTAVASFSINEPPVLLVQLQVECVSQPGASDGRVTALVSGGVMPYRYSWSTGATTSSISNERAGRVVLYVADHNDCEVMRQVQICIDGIDCYIGSTVITPNNDGKNDVFIISCIFEYDNTLSIYNRYGGLEYRMNNYNNSWDGINQSGDPLSDGGYHWVLEVRLPTGQREIHRGTVTLVRSLD